MAIDQTHERYLSEAQDVRDDQLKDFKKFQYSMCSEMIKLVRMFNSVEEVDNEMMSGLFKSCGQLMVPKGRLMRRSVIDLAVSYREQKEASFEVNTLALEPSEEEQALERALKANGYERLPIDIHHKTKNNAKHKSKRSHCTNNFQNGAPGTFLWIRHGYGDAITDIHIPQCGYQFKLFDHEYVVFWCSSAKRENFNHFKLS